MTFNKFWKILSDHTALVRSRMVRPAADRALRKLAAIHPKGASAPGGNGGVLIEGFWDSPHHWLRLAILRPILEQIFGDAVIGLLETEQHPRVRRTLSLFSQRAIEFVDPVPGSEHREYAKTLLAGVSSCSDFFKLRLPDNYAAHLLYDGIAKENGSGMADPAAPETVTGVASALGYLDQYDRILDRHRPAAVIVSHPTTIRYSSLVASALNRAIPVFILNYRNRHISVRRYVRQEDAWGSQHDFPPQNLLGELPMEARRSLADMGDQYLRAVRGGHESQFAMVGVYGDGARKFSDSQALRIKLGIEDDKPLVAVLTNCWPDFPNSNGPSWYTDYVDWFRQTMGMISTIPGVNWVLKPHPAEHLYPDKTTLKKLLPATLPENVFIWPEGANALDAMDSTDCVVTACGSAGIEYPANGRRAIVARETHYTPWGFSHFAHDRDEYFKLLSEAGNLRGPTPEQIEAARIYAALTMADPHYLTPALSMPYGLLSYRLWSDLPRFIREHAAEIALERQVLADWFQTEEYSFNTYRLLDAVGFASRGADARHAANHGFA